MKIKKIEIKKIKMSKHQTRLFDNKDEKIMEDLRNLSYTIAQNGLINPITVRPLEDDSYELIAGERRLRASKIAGKTTILCKVLDNVSEEKAAILGLVENVHRLALKPIEQTRAILNVFELKGLLGNEKSNSSVEKSNLFNKLLKDLMIIDNKLNHEKYKSLLTPEEEEIYKVCNVIGLAPITIYQSLSILKISEENLEIAEELETKKLHLTNVARLEDKDLQKEVLKTISDKKLNQKNTAKLVTNVKKVEESGVNFDEHMKRSTINNLVNIEDKNKAEEYVKVLTSASEPVLKRMLRTKKITPVIAETITEKIEEETKQDTVMDNIIKNKMTENEAVTYIDDVLKGSVKINNFKDTEEYKKSRKVYSKSIDIINKLSITFEKFEEYFDNNEEYFISEHRIEVYGKLIDIKCKMKRFYEMYNPDEFIPPGDIEEVKDGEYY